MAEKPNEELNARKTEVYLSEVVPTIYIALGGTGAEVLWRIRRRILNTLWGSDAFRIEQLTEFPVAEFLYIDLDANTVTETGKSQKTDILSEKISFKEGEKLVKKLDLMKYTRTDADLSKYPLVQEWFPLNRQKINQLNINVEEGAGQIRSFSRLYVFDRYQDIKSAIREKAGRLLANVSSDEAQKRLGLTMKTGKLKIVVIASTAGGTGSGSFIDMGYIVNLVGKQAATEGVDTNLVLMLPTGYSGANMARTQANTYAALMELETSMRQGSSYVKGWSENEIEIDGAKLSAMMPYSGVYLVDTENLGGAKTTKITDVYDMIADALFEDFSKADFANKKRSISVNQNQHKTSPYIPRVISSYGDMKLTFSRAYSSFGQATIDTHLEQKRNAIIFRQVNNMLKSFFGVSAEDARSNAPTEQERDALLKSIYLGVDNIAIDYDFVMQTNQYREGIERTTYPIVSELLSVNGVSRLGDIEISITKTFEDIRDSGSYKEWASKIAQAIDQIKHDTFKGVDSRSGMHEDDIKKRRRELLEKLLHADPNSPNSKEKGLIKALWEYVDNKERGGLDYTIELIQRLKDRMENAHTGLIKTLQENAKWFSDLSGHLRNEETTTLQEHLQQAINVKFMGAQSQSEAKRKQISNAVRLYVRYHLYAVASREAAVLLKELSDALGKQQGTDSDGNPVWSGFMGQLDEGRSMVRAIIADAEQQIALTNEAMKQDHAMYFVLPAPPSKLDELKLLPPQQAREWAEEAFQDFGGTQALFEMLKDDKSKSELWGKLSNRALSMIGGEESAAQENPLFSALEALPNRTQLFKDFLQRAMPWVAAQLGHYLKEQSPEDQYKCFIGVKDAKKFEERFGNELRNRIPSSAVMTATQIGFVEIDQPGKLVCYVELSGIPLASMKALDNWYSNYRGENEKIPVHTHVITSTFVHPRELTTDELASRAEDFKLFVQAVALGVLTRIKRDERGKETGTYQVETKGAKLAVGVEKSFRLNGFNMAHRKNISNQVELDLEKLKTADQLAIWVALMENYRHLIYPTYIHRDTENGDTPMNTFPTLLCEHMVHEWRARLDAVTGDAKVAEQLVQKARDAINQWTVEIAGSETDVYAHEVGEDHKPKRVLKREVLQEGWSLSGAIAQTAHGVGVATPPPPLVASPATPPPLPQTEAQFHIMIGGSQYGPYPVSTLLTFIPTGQLGATTNVWRAGMASWTPASQVPELAHLFGPPVGSASPPPLPTGNTPPTTT